MDNKELIDKLIPHADHAGKLSVGLAAEGLNGTLVLMCNSATHGYEKILDLEVPVVTGVRMVAFQVAWWPGSNAPGAQEVSNAIYQALPTEFFSDEGDWWIIEP